MSIEWCGLQSEYDRCLCYSEAEKLVFFPQAITHACVHVRSRRASISILLKGILDEGCDVAGIFNVWPSQELLDIVEVVVSGKRIEGCDMVGRICKQFKFLG